MAETKWLGEPGKEAGTPFLSGLKFKEENRIWGRNFNIAYFQLAAEPQLET